MHLRRTLTRELAFESLSEILQLRVLTTTVIGVHIDRLVQRQNVEHLALPLRHHVRVGMQRSRRTELQLGLILRRQARAGHHDDDIVAHLRVGDVAVLCSHGGDQVVVRDHRNLHKLDAEGFVVAVDAVGLRLRTTSVTERIDTHPSELGDGTTNRAGEPEFRERLLVAHRVLVVRHLEVTIHDLCQVGVVWTRRHEAQEVLTWPPRVVLEVSSRSRPSRYALSLLSDPIHVKTHTIILSLFTIHDQLSLQHVDCERYALTQLVEHEPLSRDCRDSPLLQTPDPLHPEREQP